MTAAEFALVAAALLLPILLLYGLLFRGKFSKSAPSPFAEVPVRLLELDGWTWRYHVSGQGPYIVLIHGLGANLFCWRFLIPYLAQNHTVVAMDLPGFGQSSKNAGATYGLDQQVERLSAFLSCLKIRRCSLVGNSMGGNIALWFALRFPEVVVGTVVIAPATSPTLAPALAAKSLWLAKPLAHLISRRTIHWAHSRTVSKQILVGPDRVEETYKTYGQNPEAIRSFLLATESIRDPRLGRSLSQLKSKVLILWGSHDRLVSRKVIDELEAKLEAHESFVHMGGGHHLQEDEPEWVARKIDAFFHPEQH